MRLLVVFVVVLVAAVIFMIARNCCAPPSTAATSTAVAATNAAIETRIVGTESIELQATLAAPGERTTPILSTRLPSVLIATPS